MLKRQVRDSRICGQGGGERGKHEYFGDGGLTFGTVSGIMAYKAWGGMEQRERKSRSRQAGQTLSGRFQGKKLGLRNRSPQIEISLSAQRKIIRLRKIGKMG